MEKEIKLNVNQKVAVLVDGNNIERGIGDLTQGKYTMADFDRVIPRIVENRTLTRFIYFREGERISDKFATKITKDFHGSVQPCGKGADVPLTIRAVQLATKVDAVIIMSGDADYVDLVDHLKHEGVRVEIAAVKGCISGLLKDRVDHTHEMDAEDAFKWRR